VKVASPRTMIHAATCVCITNLLGQSNRLRICRARQLPMHKNSSALHQFLPNLRSSTGSTDDCYHSGMTRSGQSLRTGRTGRRHPDSPLLLEPCRSLRMIAVHQFVPQVTFIDSMSLDMSSWDRSGTRWPAAKAISVPLKSLSLNARTVALEPTMTL